MIPLTGTVKMVIAGIALAAVLGIGVKIYSAGKEAGRGDGSREQLDIDKKSMEQERTAFKATLENNQEIDAKAQELIDKQQVLIDSANVNLARLSSSRAQGQKDVGALPDAALLADVRKKLNVTPADTTGMLNSVELRQVDSIVTDYPKLSDTVKELADKQAAIDKTIEGLNTRITSLSNQRDAAVSFANEMVGHYTAAYNAAQKHHSKLVTILTFGLVRTKKLDLPDPVTLSPAK